MGSESFIAFQGPQPLSVRNQGKFTIPYPTSKNQLKLWTTFYHLKFQKISGSKQTENSFLRP
ncbi:MAG: hypothetical protein A2157_04765 [Deltaproteobacteria bacterium RBG_16_47_11]|nr:MAG: hypothetical protein A2157_04765 [Deltaproteobacteria bacterium RBG_16_47_11]